MLPPSAGHGHIAIPLSFQDSLMCAVLPDAVVPASVDATGRLTQQFLSKSEQILQARIAQSVMDVTASLLARHEAALAETPQVVRRVRLRETRHHDDLAHGQGPCAQGVQD